jgi:hypothetical protein
MKYYVGWLLSVIRSCAIVHVQILILPRSAAQASGTRSSAVATQHTKYCSSYPCRTLLAKAATEAHPDMPFPIMHSTSAFMFTTLAVTMFEQRIRSHTPNSPSPLN